MNTSSEEKRSGKEQRRYLRHLLVSPLKYKVEEVEDYKSAETVNVSEGGLLFTAKKNVEPGKLIELHMPLYEKVYKIKARVVHTQKDESSELYRIGVAFTSYSDAFKVKLIEQIYLIEEYRVLRSLQTGKEYTIQQASKEWIKRYSDRFEKLYW